MKKILPIFFLIVLSLTSCNYINNKIFKPSIEGVYSNPNGMKLEFTGTKASLDLAKGFGLGTYNYMVEDKFLFVEKVSLGESQITDIQFEIVDPNTLKLKSRIFVLDFFFAGRDENSPENTFKKVVGNE
jgi:hypothetical protein